MATTITIDYDRKYRDHEVNQLINRATDTINVLPQLVAELGPDCGTLPGFAIADYQAAVDALAAKQAEVNVLHEQYPVLYHQVDDTPTRSAR